MAASLLVVGLVAGHVAFAWREAEEGVLAAAEAEGRALLGTVSAGIEANLDASRAVERLLSERLLGLASELERRLADDPGREEPVLAAFVEEHGLRGAILLDPDLGVAAASDGVGAAPAPDGSAPFAAARLERLDAADAARRAREAGLARAGRVTLGFGENPFGSRPEFLAAARAPRLPGFLLLRADATQLEAFQRDAGVARVLHDAARGPGIAYLRVQAHDGRVLAADAGELVGRVLPPPPSAPRWREGAAGGRVLDVALPVPWDDEPQGHLVVGLDAAPVEEVLRRARRNLLVFAGLVLLVGLASLSALVLADRRRRAESERLRHELEQRERLALLGRLAGGVAHEIRGPLNAASLAAQMIQREAAPEEPVRLARFRELCADLRRAVTRVDRVVGDFLALGRRAPASERRPVELGSLVAEVVAAEGVVAELAPPAGAVVVAGDRTLLATALGNLVRNARQAAPDGPVRVAWRTAGGDAAVEVSDAGPGVPPEVRAAVFQPFHTTKPDGTGLGLTLALDAAERHGGRIDVDDAPGGGARFTLWLPLVREPQGERRGR